MRRLRCRKCGKEYLGVTQGVCTACLEEDTTLEMFPAETSKMEAAKS